MNHQTEEIRTFVIESIKQAALEKGTALERLEDEFDLVQSGLIDSLGFVTLITSIENKFELEIDFLDMELEELTTLGGIVRSAGEMAERNP